MQQKLHCNLLAENLASGAHLTLAERIIPGSAFTGESLRGHKKISHLQGLEIAPHQPKRIILLAPRAISFSKVSAAMGAPMAGPAAKQRGSSGHNHIRS